MPLTTMSHTSHGQIGKVAVVFAMSMIALAAVACLRPGDGDSDGEVASVDLAVDRARGATQSLGQRLMTALGEQIASGGPVGAIAVCSEIAPAAAAELSRDGLEIRRTSLRIRNPDNAPDSWERSRLERLERSLAAGELPQEVYEVEAAAGQSGHLRYLRPIVVGPNCLACHGSEGDVSPAVRQEISRRYPSDQATGFATGDLRGAFSVRVRLDEPPSD